jgi:uncharacterized protein YhjY with autotransporter beta-barrel domain
MTTKSKIGRIIMTKVKLGVCLVIAGVAVAGPAWPQNKDTFNLTSIKTLNTICFNRRTPAGGGTIVVSPALNDVCGNAAQAGFSSPASGAAPGPGEAAIEQRLQSVREAEEERREARGQRPASASSGSPALLFASTGRLTLPPESGTAPQVEISPGQGYSLFLSTGATALKHHENRYEDGYDAALPTVTLGGDLWVARDVLVGMAVSYTYVDASYDGGGGFDKHMFGPQIYATWLPFSSAFVDLVLSYARAENDNRRKIFVEREFDTLTARTSADYGENLFSATLRFGYDYPIQNFTIGPRAGFLYAYSHVPSFEEDGNSGLELRYSDLDQSSVQTSLGLLASVSLDRSWGVIVPQASAAWVHEYLDGGRNVEARYTDAQPSPQFTFKREQRASDWALIGIGVTALLPGGFQPFAGFSTMLGNENFTTYSGSIGVRKTF